MPSELPPIEIEVSSDFKRNLRALAKRYRHIRADLEPLLAQLQAEDCPGDQISGIAYAVFKVRLRNTDAQRGKSGGYRVIYYLKTKTKIILVTIYSKSDQGDISDRTICQIIASHQAE
ncbi:type II toxin-antitoxin system RelE/ParE family toxin [Leptolyngbya sp. CCNP1308]|uniref:type II toxin-antitoxin system RelE/ParE family toxin n=1 Tax=Leptolyngbya sp. CCNP1308 TaxID=3110255 RepID=UPI002B1F92DD|nr:type II toxin-antitoxin system RelE/ParE family toxin [Leptolyngbya sp. CCNP1308]MEA5452386.1 type II toxin-antitoxin system RelE/ParE family toxin [Leptolyngbya sp. CCNP1308]